MMMALGTFVFSLSDLAYQQLQRNTNWRHSRTARVGAREASQYLGPGDDSIELSGIVSPGITGTPAALDTLRELADEGRPLALVDGTGVVHGAFVIESLNETRTLFFADGVARRIEFALSLKRTDADAEEPTE
ncbi:MAG: phage tail protein [Pseudomonadota bacterium]|nr:phage tail protein [Pseudomonadota bacterium]